MKKVKKKFPLNSHHLVIPIQLLTHISDILIILYIKKIKLYNVCE
jgi:hypothetical protein